MAYVLVDRPSWPNSSVDLGFAQAALLVTPACARAAPYLCRLSASSRAGRGRARHAGGAWARWVVWVGCARAPSLISVRDPGWLRVGDMMGDGVFGWGDAVRPLCL